MGSPNLNDDRPSDYDDPTTPDLARYQPGDNAYAEPSPYDVDYPELYEPAPRHWYPDDAYSQSQRTRANANNGSPHVIERFTCIDCGRGGTYYGRADHAPDPDTQWRCNRC